jgi:hypothetical protein
VSLSHDYVFESITVSFSGRSQILVSQLPRWGLDPWELRHWITGSVGHHTAVTSSSADPTRAPPQFHTRPRESKTSRTKPCGLGCPFCPRGGPKVKSTERCVFFPSSFLPLSISYCFSLSLTHSSAWKLYLPLLPSLPLSPSNSIISIASLASSSLDASPLSPSYLILSLASLLPSCLVVCSSHARRRSRPRTRAHVPAAIKAGSGEEREQEGSGVRAGPGRPGGWHEPAAVRMVPARSLHLVRDAHGATPFAAAGIGVTTAPPPSVHNMAQQPLDSQHLEPSKHPPPPQERQVDDLRRQEHEPLAPRQPGGGGVSQEAAGTSGSSSNGGAGDWLRLGLAPASSSSPGAVGSQPPLDLFPDRPGRPPLVSPPVFIRPALPGIPQASRTLPSPRAGPPWMPPWSPAGSAFPAAPPPPMLPFAHRTFYTPGAGASGVDTIRVVLPPPTVAGVWFALQAAPHQ